MSRCFPLHRRHNRCLYRYLQGSGGQGGTTIRRSRYAAGIGHALHCGRGAASGDGTAYLVAHHTAYVATADAARHRAVFKGAIAPSRHAADVASTVIAFYLHVLQRHVLHLAAGVDVAEQARILVTRRNGQPRDGLAVAVEGAGVSVVIVLSASSRCPRGRCRPSG